MQSRSSCQKQIITEDISSVPFILTFWTPFENVTSGLRRQSPLAYARSHAAIFAVNAALMASQWQRKYQLYQHFPYLVLKS